MFNWKDSPEHACILSISLLILANIVLFTANIYGATGSLFPAIALILVLIAVPLAFVYYPKSLDKHAACLRLRLRFWQLQRSFIRDNDASK